MVDLTLKALIQIFHPPFSLFISVSHLSSSFRLPELKHTAWRSTRNEFHSVWSEQEYIISTSAFSPQCDIFILLIFHLFYVDKTHRFFTPTPFFNIFLHLCLSPSSSFSSIIPLSLPRPSFHRLHGRERRTGLTWRLHLGPAGWLRWQTAPPEWRSAEVQHCASGPHWSSLECRPWSEVTAGHLEKWNAGKSLNKK